MNLEYLMGYYVWAEGKLKTEIEKLSKEEFLRVQPGVDRCVRDLVEHLYVTYEYYFHPQNLDIYKKLGDEAKNLNKVDLVNKWAESVKKFSEAILKAERKSISLPLSKEKSFDVEFDTLVLMYTDHSTYITIQPTYLLTKLSN